MTHGALFAGIGGFDLGFERAGIKTIWQVELNDYSRKVLAKHFPGAERFYNVASCGDRDWKLSKVDIISGGFPCQDISLAGKGAGIALPTLARRIEENESGSWPTPRASEIAASAKMANVANVANPKGNLEEVVYARTFPTPTASDAETNAKDTKRFDSLAALIHLEKTVVVSFAFSVVAASPKWAATCSFVGFVFLGRAGQGLDCQFNVIAK